MVGCRIVLEIKKRKQVKVEVRTKCWKFVVWISGSWWC